MRSPDSRHNPWTRPPGPVSTQAASAIRKLRQAMIDRGFHALRPEDPVTSHGTGRPPVNT